MRAAEFETRQVQLFLGHVLDVLREMPADSVDCVVTSPPYWGLRDYGLEPQIWGGEPGCELARKRCMQEVLL